MNLDGLSVALAMLSTNLGRNLLIIMTITLPLTLLNDGARQFAGSTIAFTAYQLLIDLP